VGAGFSDVSIRMDFELEVFFLNLDLGCRELKVSSAQKVSRGRIHQKVFRKVVAVKLEDSA
jgi:hypothetical protein